MKKNLIIIVPKLWLGGQEKVATETADLLAKEYYVTLVIFDNEEAVYSSSCETININIPGRDGVIHKVHNAVRRTIILRRLRKEKCADYVYSFGTTANLVNVLSRGIGRTIIGMRGYASVKHIGIIEKYLFLHSDSIICCAEETCRPIRQRGTKYAKKTVCLYNPLDYIEILKKGKETVEDYCFSSHTIVSHGRLSEVKNWPRLIKAFAIVKETIPDARLLIIGEGELRTELQELIDCLGLQDSVALLGFRKNPFAYLAKSSVYVLPSYSEGFPNALVEGMIFLPAISVDCKSGPREILSSGALDMVANGYEIADYGILVQPASDRVFHREVTRDDEILAEAILTVLQDPELSQKMKNAAAKRAAEFSCERYRERLKEILDEI